MPLNNKQTYIHTLTHIYIYIYIYIHIHTHSHIYDTHMSDFSELNKPPPLEETFANSPIKLGEVKDFVRKARAKNTSGINGISYKLYKKIL